MPTAPPRAMPKAAPRLLRVYDKHLDTALEARAALHEARSRARKEGRPETWWASRPESQRWPGLANEGATCSLNSLLQALHMLPDVRRMVFDWAATYDEALHGPAASCVPLQLGRLFAHMQRSRLQALSARPLIGSFGWSAADSARQHDVSELSRALFEALG
eukprot:5582468-Prymnesium_polylepis.1